MYLSKNDKDELAKLIIDLFDEYEKNPDAKVDDKVKNNPTRRGGRDVRRILRMIERYNPGVFRNLMRYGMPYQEARRIIRRIIRLTLIYYED